MKKKKKKDKTHYCIRCKKRTQHKPNGIRWVNYYETCLVCRTINYSEFQTGG